MSGEAKRKLKCVSDLCGNSRLGLSFACPLCECVCMCVYVCMHTHVHTKKRESSSIYLHSYTGASGGLMLNI